MRAPFPLARTSRSWLLGPLVVACLACTRVASPPTADPSASSSAPTGNAIAWRLDRSTFEPSVDPCSDFYQHVCGGFATVAHIPADRGSAAWVSDAASATNDRAIQQLLTGTDRIDDPEVGRLRTFFASCMATGDAADKIGDATLARWLGRIEAIQTPGDVMAVIRELHAHGIQAMFQYSGEPDRGDRTRYRGEIGQGTFGSRGLHAATGPGTEDRRAAYRAHVQKMFELSGIDAARAQSDARAASDVEARLTAVALDFGDQFDPAVSEHPMTPKALAALAPHIDWAAYLAMVGHPPDRPVNVTSPAYLKVVDEQLADRPSAALRAYLRWQLLYSLASALPARLAEERYRFSALPGVPREPRAAECQLETLKALGVELSRQFAHRFIGPALRDRARPVAEGVQAEMARAIPSLGWLSPAARAAAEQKLRALALKVGFPEAWPATGSFPLRTDAFLDNVLAARQFEQQRSWARARAERRRESWENTVYPNAAPGMAVARLTIANAFPDALSNSILFTAAYLRPPLFDPQAPPEVRYGGFGAIVGHEIVHTLENHEFDSVGELHDAWTAADTQAHDARRACVIEQANQFVAFDTTHLDGKHTCDENVADLSGVAYAYAAMARALGAQVSSRGADGLTPAQRFFVAYAQHWCDAERPEYARENLRHDPHAPPRFRVNGPLSNLPAFAEAFSCPAGAAMARPAPSRCAVW
jgi:putative endopeptidase